MPSPWSRYSARLRVCVAGQPGEVCQGGGTIYVGIAVDPELIEEPMSLAAVVSAGITPYAFLLWDEVNGVYKVELAGAWAADGLQNGDRLTHYETVLITEDNVDDINFRAGGYVSIVRGSSALDLTLSALPD